MRANGARVRMPETSTERVRQWRANYEKEQADYRRRYAKNPDKFIARSKARYALVKARTPKWMRLKEIENVYKFCPQGFHVDHIVPLEGTTADGYPVSGLHVPWNLRFLTPAENSQKGSGMRAEDHDAEDVTGLLALMPEWQRVSRGT